MLEIRPCNLRDANRFVEQHHRHHKVARGHRFSISAWRNDEMVGVAIAGRPVSRECDPLKVLEVNRLCTIGGRNVCSKLYAAVARIGREMGFAKVQTYILDTEPGTSLKAAGWQFEDMVKGRQWKHTDGNPRRTDQPVCDKQRWGRVLRKNGHA